MKEKRLYLSCAELAFFYQGGAPYDTLLNMPIPELLFLFTTKERIQRELKK